MATRTIANAGGNWTANGTWVEGVAPTSADDVVATGTSGPVTVDTGAVCRSMNLTGYVNTLTLGANLTVGDAGGGNITLGGGMTFIRTAGGIINSSTAVGNLITTNGVVVPAGLTLTGAGGAWTLADNYTNSFGNIAHTAGTFSDGGRTVTVVNGFQFNGGVARTANLTGVWNITSTATLTVWNVAGSNMTLNASTVTVNIAGAALVRTFIGGGQAYGTLNAEGHVTITGANTFANLSGFHNQVGGTFRTLVLPAAATTTVTNPPTFRGMYGSPEQVKSSSAGSAAVISCAAGVSRSNHCEFTDITFQGGATFEAYDSRSISGVTGLTHVAARKMALAGVG